MENLETKTICLVETILKKTSVKLDAPKYVFGIEEVREYFVDLIGSKTIENFYIMYMNSANELIAMSEIAKGDVSNVTLSITEVLRIGILVNAKFFLLVHNHPSGVALPSDSDCDITKKIAQAASLFNMHLLDSIIVCGNGETYSMREMVSK